MDIVAPNPLERKGWDGGPDDVDNYGPDSNGQDHNQELTQEAGSEEENLYTSGDDNFSHRRGEESLEIKGTWQPETNDRRGACLSAQEAVECWPIKRLGRRPKDFIARDLLLNSLWRDERPRLFHAMSRKPPAWIEDSVAHLRRGRTQAIEFQALHFFHRRLLERLARDPIPLPTWDEAMQNEILMRLINCWPYGVELYPPAGEEARRYCWCRMAWLCPWCYARRAVQLLHRLCQGPLKNPKGKHLILGTVQIRPDLAYPDFDWAFKWEPSRPFGNYYLQSHERLRDSRNTVMRALRTHASFLGITGGLIAHQIGPDETVPYRHGISGGLRGWRQQFAILGEVTLENEEQVELMQYHTAYNSHWCSYLLKWDPDYVQYPAEINICWSFHPADDKRTDALRLFLCGSSMDYPVGNLEWFAGGASYDRFMSNKVRGAFAL